jgi:predicted nucleic acid-binding protein
VTVIIDAAPLVALSQPDDPRRDAVLDVLRSESGSLVIPAPVTAEIDYMLGERFGRAARVAFLKDLATGRFDVACLEHEDYTRISELDARYADLELGLADCAVIVLARRYKTSRVVSFDERHFRAVTPLQGGAFALLPQDA